MKALTLTQPWATLVAIGAKKIETRSWATRYRGSLAIHAAKTWPGDCRRLCDTPPFAEALRGALGPDFMAKLDGERGRVLAVAYLVDVITTKPAVVRGQDARLPFPGSPEFAFGDFSPGRFAWLLDEIAPLPIPTAARGALGLWDWEPRAGVTA